jgi:AraC family transcriptional regulator of adaptative response/methylated-DNA-[protein]-cysteine methyltransferase
VLPLAVGGTNFQVKVWQALIETGSAATTTYSRLAAAAGAGAAARAVGNAVAANPVAWLIPCHKVLRQDGALGGYHYGADRKRAPCVRDRHRAGEPGACRGVQPPPAQAI